MTQFSPKTESTENLTPRKAPRVQVVEVGLRDGLQNEADFVPTSIKIQWVESLIASGIKEIELTSFVSPKKVPQLADAEELYTKVHQSTFVGKAQFSALVPNQRGLERALSLGVERIALFTAASNTFTLKNIGMTIEASLKEFSEVIRLYRQSGGKFVRGYVSTAIECPFEGRISPSAVAEVVRQLIDLGIDEIAFGETLGVAVPSEIDQLLHVVLPYCNDILVSCHFHDTHGGAIANVAEALDHGITRFDASAGGLGGCPYAPGAGGNLSTEDLVYFLERSGYDTGVNLQALAQSSLDVLQSLGKTPFAKSQLAALARCPQ